MRQRYPRTINCWYNNYPRAIKITFGPEIALLGGPWNSGGTLDLLATPLSEVWQGALPNYLGGQLNPLEAIYTDTGLENDYKLKLIMEGYGTFVDKGAPNFWLKVEKFFKILSKYNGKTYTFSRADNIYTQIPVTINIPGLALPVAPPIVINPDPPSPPGPGPGPIPPYTSPDFIEHGQFIDKFLIEHADECGIVYSPMYRSTVSKIKENATSYSSNWLEPLLSAPYRIAGYSLVAVYQYYDLYVFMIKKTSYVAFLCLFCRVPDIGEPIYMPEFAYTWNNIMYRGNNITLPVWNWRD